MPTTRPRHVVTEVDEIAAALDEAAKMWPQYRKQRGKLLYRLIEEGHKAIRDDRRKAVERRRAAIREAAGSLTGLGDSDGLDAVEFVRRMRDESPQ